MASQVEVHHDLETVLAHVDDGFIAVDHEWRCTYANNKAADLAGYPSREMIGQSIWELLPAVIGSDGYRQLHEAMEQRKPLQFEYRLADGSRWFEHRAYPSNSGLAICSVDITEKKEYQSRFLQNQERLAATYDNAPVGIAETDSEGRYLRVNRKWCEITGYSPQELLRRPFSEFTHPEDITPDMLNYQALFNDEIQSYELEKRYLNKTGSLLWVQVHRSLVHRRDGSVFGIGIVQDITQRKRAEEELKKAQEELRARASELEQKVAERTAELEKSNKAMESFCYSIAHDLRAPIRAMQGFTLALNEDYSSQLDATGRDYARRINKASERMDCLIQDLLAFGQLTHMELPTEEVDLEVAVGSVLVNFAPQIKHTNGIVDVSRPLSNVMGNPLVLNQILSNLVSNALRFVAPGVAPQLKIWTERTDSTVTISVQDNGIGIAPEHHERIFRLFEALQPTATNQGTGIGLALVQQGAERLGGRVGVESREGQGSRFWVELPAASETPVQTDPL